jgi:antitoxin ParD1/3/4
VPTRNVNLTDELDRFVLAKVESGRYENASEVVRAALRTLEREEQHYEAKLTPLRAAVDEGDATTLIAGGCVSSLTLCRSRHTEHRRVYVAHVGPGADRPLTSLKRVVRGWPTTQRLAVPATTFASACAAWNTASTSCFSDVSREAFSFQSVLLRHGGRSC